MAEIVPVEHSHGRNRSSTRNLLRSKTVGYVAEPFNSENLPPTLISDIRRFLRVANQIESEAPRVACLCRFHAFQKAHTLDPSSSGRRVRQFKTALLQRLERDEEATKFMRKEMSDERELKRFYHKYEDYIRKHEKARDSAERDKLVTARVIASVLFEVLKTVTADAAHEILDAGKDIKYVPYNILPLDPGGAQQAIMQLPEIKAAVTALHNVRGLPLSENHTLGNVLDLLDWLQHWFGFQRGNVSNQREHLILLLANMHIRQTPKPESFAKLDERAVDELMKKLLKNYMNWCKFLGRKSNIWVPSVRLEVQQYKILYISLYLLIWGEASNLRLMPECLCYIYHNMAYEMYGVLSGATVLITGQKVVPAYGGQPDSFLNNVITPIYKVIYEESQKNQSGTADHSKWRNYDDLNEYFWSPDCFRLGWPMHLDNSFFYTFSSNDNCRTTTNQVLCDHEGDVDTCVVEPSEDDKPKWLEKTNLLEILSFWRLFVPAFLAQLKEHIWTRKKESEDNGPKWLGKTNFVEIRSFWHLFRSFDRMWTFLILALQVMIIMAWHGLRSPIELFDAAVLENILSIFITSAILKFVQAMLDIVVTWKARHTMSFFQNLRYVLKIVVAATWAIVLPINYAHSGKNYSCSGEPYRSWIGEWRCFSPYIFTIAIYLVANTIGMALFFVPALSSYIETSNWRILTVLSWWAQPRLYVGRGMQESQFFLLKYTIFWVLLLISKFSFSYYFEIKPLVEPTKQIMQIGVSNYEWHELFPKVKRNAGAVLSVWAPVILVYFMDTQIWYAVFCTIFGGVYGVFNHLGEIRTMGMLRSRFESLPAAFNVCLFPPTSEKEQKKNVGSFFGQKFSKVSENDINVIARFSLVWNQIITSFRSEDLISNREMDLMIIPVTSELASGPIRWPVFLLATKFSTALNMAKDFVGKDRDLFKKIRKDSYMYYAIKECYESLKYILDLLVVGDLEKRVISEIFHEVETSISRSSLLEDFKMAALPDLHDKFIQLVYHLVENKHSSQDNIVKLLQDMFEVVTKDMMIHGSSFLDSIYCSQQLEDAIGLFGQLEALLFAPYDSISPIHFPLTATGSLKGQLKRLFLLLTAKESAMDIPVNLDARRRISFFTTSLFMDMPNAPKVSNMLPFSVMTPYYMEEVNFSEDELHSREDGVPIIFYMQTIYPDEWKNFLERMECESEDEFSTTGKMEELRNWASSRGQTLSRTVRGMMYYRKALKLQAFLDTAKDDEILEGYNAVENELESENSQGSMLAQLEALADLKFTYVVSCQMYGAQKSCGDLLAQDILDLMIKYPSLRVAYIEEKEEIVTNKPHKVYSSVLVKAFNKLDQEIYRIKLPGPPIIGEGKPENQNHAIIFTRGEALQTIDMNQDNYMEEALKMRNILQEFVKHQGDRPPTIVGLREHIFTGSVSSLAGFMSYQETSFVTIGQRLLSDPLRVRFHYGHPDLFDRVFHLTRGGISKASKTINLSEDVFAGFNSTLRRGHVTYHEYMQVGKGRDVGLNQISKFEAKVANGNSEQTLSRDMYRLGHRFDFFRMLACYFTTVGFYFNSLITVISVYVFLYGQLYLILSGMEKAILVEARTKNIESLEMALASQSFIQLGLLTGLPMVMEIGLEKGFRTALSQFVVMQLQLAPVFFTFSLGTKSHYYGRTLLHGGAKYRPTGRKFVIFHASFTENYRLYSRSHFVKGFELMLLLIIYNLYRHSYQNSMTYMIVTYSIWFMAGTWLFAPFLFNPSGFLWPKVVDDWVEWNRWIKNRVGIGVHQDKSWEAWWNEEQAHLKYSGWSSRILEILLSLRFFIYQYGLVYHLDISQANKNISVYFLSWFVIASIFTVIKVLNLGRQRLSADFQLLFRFFKMLLFLGSISIIIALSITCKLSVMDLFICFLAFLPTGWGLLLIAQAVKPLIQDWGIWDSVQVLAQAYDYGMGILLFSPIAALAWLPVISAFQNRFLFNQAFSRRLQIQPILSAKNKYK